MKIRLFICWMSSLTCYGVCFLNYIHRILGLNCCFCHQNASFCSSAQACSAIADLSVFPIYLYILYSFAKLQGPLYMTPVLPRRGSICSNPLSCLWSVEIVVNTVLISNLLHILLRSSLTCSPDISLLTWWYFNVSIGLEDFLHMPLLFPEIFL